MGQTPIMPVKVQTQVVSSTTTGQTVYAWIQNTGTDTLRNITYVWYMDWTDHGSPLVPELDYSSISGVTASAVLRPDYIAEARYSLGTNKIAPGQTVQLNTRLHLKDWSVFNTGNDWSSLGAKTSLADNPYASIFTGPTRIWGNPEQRVGPAVGAPQVQVRTVASYVNNNTIGMEVHVVNTGTVPVTNVVSRWISSTLGRTASVAAELDYTSADTTRLRVLPADGTRVPVDMDLGGTIIGVGLEKILRIRLHSSDWTNVDWTQDWSYSGVSATAYNPRVNVEVRGYPQSGSAPQDVDSDGDGWSDAVEQVWHTDPNSVTSHPTGATMTGGYIQDTSVSHVVTYNASSLAGYSTRTSLPLTVDAGAVQGVAPVISISTNAPPPVFQGAVQVGKVLEISGAIRPGHTLTMPIPLPNGLPVTLPSQVQVIHFVNGNWQREIVTDIKNGAAYTTLSSFSPVVIGLVQSTNTIAAGGNHGLWIRHGRLWSAGQNDRGQLGNRTTSATPQAGFDAVYWPSATPVVAVAAGVRHSLALDATGSVWAWGDNQQGQCGQAVTGDATKDFYTQPVLVIDAVTYPDKAVIQIAAGDTTSYALTAEGKILSWGANSSYQLGHGFPTSGSPPAFDPVPAYVVRLDSSGTYAPLDSFCQIGGGRKHAIALRYNSEVRVWGANDVYQRGPGDYTKKAYSVVLSFNLYDYGSDTLRYSYSTPVGGGGGIITRPWYAPPSQIAANGDMSYAELFRTYSQNAMALNMVWGANDSAQIKSPASANGVATPTSVTSQGRSQVALGRSHLVMLYDAGFSGSANGAIHWFPVQAKGANGAGQSDPTAIGPAVNAWKEVLRPGATRRMISNAVAAGGSFSMSYDYGQDLVYRWGSDWGAGTGVSPMSTTNGSVLEIISPREGDTVSTGLDSISVGWRLWAKDGTNNVGSTTVALTCLDTNFCTITITQGGSSATLHVVRRALRAAATPLLRTIDRGLGQDLAFRLHLPFRTDSTKILVWLLRNPNRALFLARYDTLATGETTLTPKGWQDTLGNWTSILDGSYGFSILCRFVGKTKWDTIAATVVEKPQWVWATKTTPSDWGIPFGGPDSFKVALPGSGILQGFIRRTVGELPGVLMPGGWEIRDSGVQSVVAWNLSDSTQGPAYDTLSLAWVGWYFQKVRDGLRLKGLSCLDSLGMNSFHLDPFRSEVQVDRAYFARTCAERSVSRNLSGSTLSSGPFNGSAGLAQDVVFPWMGPGLWAHYLFQSPSNYMEQPVFRSLQVVK